MYILNSWALKNFPFILISIRDIAFWNILLDKHSIEKDGPVTTILIYLR